jgi:hypothetical protein
MKLIVVTLFLLQFGQRPPLTPAQTLLEPAILKAINEQPSTAAAVTVISGSDRDAGEILLTCVADQCTSAGHAASKLASLIAAKTIAQPPRTIRVVSAIDPTVAVRSKAAIHVAESTTRSIQVIRGLWSSASIGDEVAEVFSKHGGLVVETRPFENVGQLRLDSYGVPVTTVVANPAMSNQHAAFVAAATAYFLATLPNSGSEALLSHLLVGAHARLAEDGRKAVAQMGAQQRASGEVLMMFANAIDREQRRIRSFEQFMPAPVDPQLHSRIVDMENGITGVWASIGITPSPFVPPAQRIRGRGGEDRRVPSRTAVLPLPKVEAPTAFLKFENADIVVAELGNFIDGKRSISDIRDAVSAEFSPIALPVVSEYFDRLAKTGAITIQ